MASRPPSPSAISAAVRRRIAESLHDYADKAETSEDPMFGGNSDVNRSIRFAAEIVAGNIHNEHSPECGCPCDKPDSALLLAWDPPTRAEVEALAKVIKQANFSHATAMKLARLVLSAGYRTVAADQPAEQPTPRSRKPDRVERAVEVAAYIQRVPNGPPVLRVPCWVCNRWYVHPAGNVMPGDRVNLPVTCQPGSHQNVKAATAAKVRTAVVQAVPFDLAWEYQHRITNAYRTAVGALLRQRSLRITPPGGA